MHPPMELPDWETFENQVQKLRASFDDSRDILFRGHEDSGYELCTTLERAGCPNMSFREYYSLAVHNVCPAVETFTGTKWDVPPYGGDVEKIFTSFDGFSLRQFPGIEFYRYLVYLRHHGFPSPLLDWTRSPYVAAFFAFRKPGTALKRSIYAYIERPLGFKPTSSDKPMMRSIGPYVRSHQRHFRQQSNYTMAALFTPAGWSFHPHQAIIGQKEWDVVWKFNLPSTERPKVLTHLNDYDLNAFSLFNSDEALLETMWFREYEINSRMK